MNAVFLCSSYCSSSANILFTFVVFMLTLAFSMHMYLSRAPKSCENGSRLLLSFQGPYRTIINGTKANWAMMADTNVFIMKCYFTHCSVCSCSPLVLQKFLLLLFSGNWTCCLFLKTFHLPSRKLNQFSLLQFRTDEALCIYCDNHDLVWIFTDICSYYLNCTWNPFNLQLIPQP